MAAASSHSQVLRDIRAAPDRWPEKAGSAKRSAPARAAEVCPIGFVLFLILTAILFIRPGEIFPSLEGLPIYEVMILICVSTSITAVVRKLTWRSLVSQPAHLCVIGLLPAIILSHISHGDTWNARRDGIEFLKVLIYYFLLVGLLTTRRRINVFLGMLLVFIAAMATLSLLTYHGLIDVEGLNPIAQHMGLDEYGDSVDIPRLQGLGIFNDPNDFSLVLVAGMLIAAQLFTERRNVLRRLLCVIAIAGIGYAFYLTRSRGGFLSFLAGSATFLLFRYPWKRAVPIMVLALPVVLFLFGGRQTDIDLSNNNDTAQGRIHLWRDSLVLFHQAPIFGIGSNKLADVNDLVAHNSYVQAFAELGLVGGALFVGVLSILFSDLNRLSRSQQSNGASNRSGWPGCVLAILIGYSVGLFSLTRTYTVSTYAILGLAAAITTILAAEHPEILLLRKMPMARRIAVASIACLLGLEFCARFLAT